MHGVIGFLTWLFPTRVEVGQSDITSKSPLNGCLEQAAKNSNRILLTLATGTGKTSIAFQIAWKLFQARWNLSGEPTRRPRVLFLADRNNLANQAFNDFTSFAAFEDNALLRIDPDSIRRKRSGAYERQHLLHDLPDIHERAAQGWQAQPLFWWITRRTSLISSSLTNATVEEPTTRAIGVASSNISAPAVQLGLTATPKRKDNVDTYAYFR